MALMLLVRKEGRVQGQQMLLVSPSHRRLSKLAQVTSAVQQAQVTATVPLRQLLPCQLATRMLPGKRGTLGKAQAHPQ